MQKPTMTQQKQLKQQQQSIQQQKQQQMMQAFNPVENYNNQIFQQILTKTKRQIPEQMKSLKRREKLQKLRAQHVQDLETKRQRNRQRHQRDKQKLQKELEGMTEEEKRAHIDLRKKQRADFKNKAKQYLEQEKGMPFIIDIAYEHRMNNKENKSLAIQIDLIIKAIKRMDEPPNIYLSGLKGRTKKQLQIMQYQHWPLKAYEQDLKECLQKQRFKGKQVYYLSPDSPDTLQTIGKDDVFIIGGLVDRTVIKNASFYRAMELGIKSVSLPIKPYMKNRHCLNLDHIVAIMEKYVQTKDWKEAFYYGAPKRWKKTQQQISQGKQASGRSSKNDSQGSQIQEIEEKPQKLPINEYKNVNQEQKQTKD